MLTRITAIAELDVRLASVAADTAPLGAQVLGIQAALAATADSAAALLPDPDDDSPGLIARARDALASGA